MKRDVNGKKLFIFDPAATAWAAYDAQGNRVMTGSASGGMDFCPDINEPCRTVTGTFKVFNKKGEDCKSNEYPLLNIIYHPAQFRGEFDNAWNAANKPQNIMGAKKDVVFLADELNKKGYATALHNPSDADVVYGVYDVGEYWKSGTGQLFLLHYYWANIL